MAAAVVVDTSEMMDQDEEVALELSNWIGGSDGIFSSSSVILLSKKEGRDGLQYLFFVERHH